MTAGKAAALAAGGRFFGWLISPSWTTLGSAALILAFYLAIGLGPGEGLFRLQKLVTGGSVYADDSLFLYNQVSLLNETIKRGEHRQTVAYVGGSTTREAIYSELALEQEIQSLTGQNVRAFDLTSSSQTLITSWNLAELAACSGVDLVILGLNHRRLRNTGTNHPADEVGYLGEAVARYIAAGHFESRLASQQSQKLTSIRSRTAKLWNLVDAVASGRPTAAELGYRETGRHRFLESGLPRKSPAELETQLARIERDANKLPNGDLLFRIVETVKNCGSRIVVFFSPVSPIDAERYPQLAAGEAQVQSIVAASSLSPADMLDLRPLGWSAEDFHDWAHFSDLAAIRRATHAIAAFAAGHMEDLQR